MNRAVAFTRVSTNTGRQDTKRQVDDVLSFCEKKYSVVEVIEEKQSGAKKNKDRVAIQRLIQLAENGKVDVIVISELTRLGRKPFEVESLIERLSELNVAVEILNLGVKTLDENGKRTPVIDLIVSVMNQFGAMERTHIIERIKSGQKRAKEILGKHIGRPFNSIETKENFLSKYKPAIRDIKNGLSIRKTARLHEISIPTVMKLRREIL
jgi:DNA invertase Pin-like site-specific DNA recombinase